MAEFVYFTGPMDCGKSTLALQLDYTHTAGGRKGRLFTSQDRAGRRPSPPGWVWPDPPSRSTPDFDFWAFVVDHLTGGERIDYLVCDETQFYTAEQIDQLARIVDELQIDVFAVGILTDFQTRLFPGSQRLVELCDKIEMLQVRSLCWCGARATHNARTIDGEMVLEGDQVMVGDTVAPGELPAVIAYEVLCRRHHRAADHPGGGHGRPRRTAAVRTRRDDDELERLTPRADRARELAAHARQPSSRRCWPTSAGSRRTARPPAYEAGTCPARSGWTWRRELSGPPGAGGRHPLPARRSFEHAMRRIGARRATPRSWPTTRRPRRPPPGCGGC